MLKKGSAVPIGFDRCFKQIFGNNDAIERVEYFLSEYLGIPREELKGNVTVIESEKRINTKNSKRQTVDVITDIDLPEDKKRVNIELNLFEDNTKRNIIYVCNLISGSIRNKEAYSKMPKILQINFNGYEVDKANPRIVQRYYLKNEMNHILDEGIEIDQISLEKSYKAWYDGSIKEEEKKDQKIIQLGALLYINDMNEIRSFIERELDMEEELKEEIIDAVEEYNEDENERLFYDKELDDWKIRQGALDDAESKGRKEGYNEGYTNGTMEEKISVAKNMLKEKLPLEQISRLTGLSKEELEKLK